MELNSKKTAKWGLPVALGLLALAALWFAMIRFATKQLAQGGDAQITFQSPAEAGAALVKSAKGEDENLFVEILGAKTKALLTTGDKETDKAAMAAFASKYEKMNRWIEMNDGSRVLYIGADNFAFPVPLAKNSAGQWYFDGVAGAEEVRARDIGRNELLTIDACAALAAAQTVYLRNAGASAEYAQRIISSAGKQDGLYWPASEHQGSSPLAGLSKFPKSSLTSLSPDQPLVIDGYALRILTAQGDGAPGGARSYTVNGKMTGGFAILATPVNYAETGIMTFMTGQDGVVFERDLGPDTAKITASIQEFNPTDDWSPVK
ncbi:MAG: DUF2950 family protein [Terriglobales bacterium]|jgi:hypothetical protein